jgi:PKD repeat protein
VSNNLEIGQQYGVGPSAKTAALWLTGWQDNGTNLLSGTTWSQTVGGDGTLCFIDYTNDNNMYASYPYGTLYFSNNGGGRWRTVGTDITEAGPWVTPWLEDPVTANTVYAGYSNVWKSTDQGTRFTQISTWAADSSQMTCIVVAPSNVNYIYASQDSLLYYTANGGTTWTNITGALPVNNAGIYALGVSPTNPQKIWVCFSGYSANNKVYESTNAGGSWTNLSGGLPNLPVNCIVYQAGSPDGIYVGTDQGIYYHDTIIGGWVDYSNGLPNTVVQDLKISKASNQLLAATYGRGTWETATYTSPTNAPVASFSAYPTAFCVGDTVQFTDLSTNQPDRWAWTFAGGNPATSNIENPTVGYATAGTYQVTLTASNINGSDSITKSSYITVYAIPPVPVITMKNDTLNCSPSTMSSYQWFYNNVLINGANQSSYIQSPYLSAGNYRIEITNSNGCSDSSSSYTVLSNGIANQSLTSNGVTLYPNPASGNVQLQLNSPEGNYTLKLTNILGQTLYSTSFYTMGIYSAGINLTPYGNGVYFITISGNCGEVTKKVVSCQ